MCSRLWTTVSAQRQSKRRISASVSGLKARLFFPHRRGARPDHRQEGIGQQRQGDLAIPGLPPPNFIVAQADLLLGCFEAGLDQPAQTGGADDLRQGRRPGGKHQKQLSTADEVSPERAGEKSPDGVIG